MKHFLKQKNNSRVNSIEPLTIGVTGTKGKTSTVNFIAQLMESAELKVAYDCTVNCRLESFVVGPCQTPDDVKLLLKLCKYYKVDCIVLEVSCGVLAHVPLDTVCNYDCAVFTNLAPDHLNMFRSMRNYLSVKKKLFSAVKSNYRQHLPKWLILNRDDPYWDQFLKVVNDGVNVATYSAGSPIGPPVSFWDFRAKNVDLWEDGTRFDLIMPDGTIWRCETPLRGMFNVSNILAAVSCALLYGVSPHSVIQGLKGMIPPAGRFEVVKRQTDSTPWIIVDYAHTSESLNAALLTARNLVPHGRVLCVLGCGGDCYKAKRPRMGRVIGKLADMAILTSDNPRSEDPQQIIKQIKRGIDQHSSAEIILEPDRKLAIEAAITNAKSQDVVLIVGKGHEATQTIGKIELPFSDKEVALEALLKK